MESLMQSELSTTHDPSQYERDTFNYDRVEVMRGSASMLSGRGSTGGVVNQVTKKPFLSDQHEVQTTLGTGGHKRITGDFNIKTGDDAAFHLNVMRNTAGNKGAEIDKVGIAPVFAWGIGTRDEFSAGVYHLESDNVPMAGIRYLDGNVPDIEAGNFYGTKSDYLLGKATYGTLAHIHRFGDGSELRTQLRSGTFDRSQWGRHGGIRPRNHRSQPEWQYHSQPDRTLAAQGQVQGHLFPERLPRYVPLVRA